MMFDNVGDAPPTRWQLAARHAPLAFLAVAAVLVAGSVHFASAALAVVAAGHLVLAALAIGMRALRRRSTGAGGQR